MTRTNYGAEMRLLRYLCGLLVVSTLGLSGVPSAAAAGDVVRVDLGEARPTGLVFHASSQRIVITVDDEVRIFDVSGTLVATVTDIPGAMDPEEAGDHVVVGSPSTGEIVVIDPRAGQVEKRILAGAQRLSSLATVGDTIWYAHGPDQWDAGIGKASISTGVATPNQPLGQRHALVYSGSVIDVSPGNPTRVYIANSNLSPTSLDWADEAGNVGYEPYHDSFTPFVAADNGQVVWAYRNGNVVALDADSLTMTGFFFETPTITDVRGWRPLLVNHDDERLAFTVGNAVTQYDTSSNRIANSTVFDDEVLGVDVDDRRLMVVTGRYDRAASSQLIVMERDGQLPPPPPITFEIDMYGFGTSEDPRPLLTYDCGSMSNTVGVLYGLTLEVTVPAGTTRCAISVTRPNSLLQRSFFDSSGQEMASSTMTLELTGNPMLDWVELVDFHPSPLSNRALLTRQAFNDLLQRDPTGAELADWDLALGNGTPPERLIASLARSEQFLGQVAPITRLYSAYFDRQPDDAGLAYWLAQRRGGLLLDDISALFESSREFTLTYGSVSDEQFVELVYQGVLRRSADQAGKAYWLELVRRGMGRGQVMTSFSESPENIRLTQSAISVRALYYGFLGREPDATGDAYWRQVYDSGAALDAMVSGFLDSSEYRDRFWIDDSSSLTNLRVAASTSAQSTSATHQLVAIDPQR